MCERGVWQLQQVLLRYSETGYSSSGVRFYLKHLLPSWEQRNPQVEVLLQQDKYAQPQATFVFRSGARSETPLANLQPRQLEELLQLHRDSSGPNHFLKHGGPKVWTERRSIQGLWRPSLPSQLLALRWFRRTRPPMRLPKYSAESLRLSIQAIRGEGRWGSEREFPKGWDQLALKYAHYQPLMREPVVPTVKQRQPQQQQQKQQSE
ncbi:uncharacterized protein EMH_0013870 [Eimeria mitis]|uniref:Large ribosomal subunit protein mL43 n=1 Tax=Eimeria mitis TaxID=44415 RepID=U6K9H6_9EIME|nr:uncharacterized protein EMH_0013870 [Eimeria mitis]CDJ32832.1 hypothetical protein, conserved [Eimeria mitis]